MASRAASKKRRAPRGEARAPARRGSALAAWVSVTVVAGLSLLYGLEPDGAYALTVWPAWVWLWIGLATLIPAWRRSRMYGILPLVVWVAFAAVFVEEVRTVPRGWFSGTAPSEGRIDVVSLNCKGGDGAAVVEAISRPDTLVLLQESPHPARLRELIEFVWADGEWALVPGPDGSIFAPGRLEALKLPEKTSNFVAARWIRSAGAKPIYVVCLRLSPPVLRFDYWNPECWRAYASDKRRRRRELAEIVAFLDRLPAGAPVIVGGDFNAPPHRTLQGSLRARFLDVFERSGAGWGATGTNDTPVVRIDQIWVSPALRAVSASAEKSHSSDHRLVAATLVLP